MLPVFYYLIKNSRLISRTIVITGIVSIFTLSPLIVSAYNQIELRFLISTTFYVTIAVAIFSMKLFLSTNITRTAQRSAVLIILLIGGLLVSAGSTTSVFFRGVKPIVDSTRNFVVKELKNCEARNLDRILITESKIRFQDRNRIGMFNQQTDLQSSWVPYSAVFLISQEVFGGDRKKIIFTENVNVTSEECVIELGKIPNELRK